MTSYKQDIIAWSQEQAGFLKSGRFDLLDYENIAEEILDVGKSEARELESRMAVLICHLLKAQYQLERLGNSWQRTIREQRKRILIRINKTPSLKSFFIEEERFGDAYLDGRLMAEKETGLDCFPDECPWTLEQIIDDNFFPEQSG
jgi:Domain of unknown function DUF29